MTWVMTISFGLVMEEYDLNQGLVGLGFGFEIRALYETDVGRSILRAGIAWRCISSLL